jgi:hypothetical protein
MKAAGSSEILATHQTTRRHVPDEINLHGHRDGNLKCRVIILSVIPAFQCIV